MRTLVLRDGGKRYALPVGDVDETMRTCATEPIAGAPEFVRGVAIIRGHAVPVVELGKMLGGSNGAATRLVTVRLGERRVALAVEEVVGVRDLDDDTLAPPLLRDVRPDVVAGLDRLDNELLVVLRTGRMVPDELWALIDEQKDER